MYFLSKDKNLQSLFLASVKAASHEALFSADWNKISKCRIFSLENNKSTNSQITKDFKYSFGGLDSHSRHQCTYLPLFIVDACINVKKKKIREDGGEKRQKELTIPLVY